MRIDFSPIRFFTDNTTLNTGSGGDVIGSDDIGGVKYQRVKLIEGADGVNDGDISSANPLPVAATLIAQTQPTPITMQNAASANGDGTILNVQGYDWAVISVVGASSPISEVAIEISADDITWSDVIREVIAFGNIANGSITVTTSELYYRIPVGGFKSLRTRILNYVSGTVTTKGYVIPISSTLSGIVTLTADDVGLLTTSDFQSVLGTSSIIIDTQADNLANSQDTIAAAALGYVFDGSTWDRARGSSTDGLLVNLGTNNDVTVTGSVNATITKPLTAYCYNIPSQVHVAVASTVHWDMFNADAALIVRVLSIKQIPNITTAVTGIVFDWLLERTTSAGTGGTTLTAWLADLNDTALDADITARSKPTGAAAQSTDLFNYALSSEETNAATIMVASLGGLELVPEHLRPNYGGKGIVLRQNQGLRCVQVTSSAAGNTGWLISFTVE